MARQIEGSDHHEAVHEGVTMTFYVCIVLAAEFAALGEHVESVELAMGAIWGTTLGLAVAHVFAFTLSAQLLRGGPLGRHGREVILGQVGAAGAVAMACTIPFFFFDPERALDVAAFTVASLVGLAAYLIGRNAGAGVARSLIYGALVLVVATAVVTLKVNLTH